jgi:hypothetical protein
MNEYKFGPHGPTAAQRKALRESGLVIKQGKIAEGGYRAARVGGGYADEITPAEGAVAITRGCPGYHAEVAIPDTQ